MIGGVAANVIISGIDIVDSERKNLQHSNILYLTKNCNLKCDYCFEKGHHRNESISYSGIDSFVDDVLKREPNGVSTLCLFGGEPFLEFKKILYVVDKCVEIQENTGKQFAFSVITNGTLLHSYIDDLKRITSLNHLKFSLDVSYDCSFQFLREKTGIVERNLNLLLENNIPFGISYTYMVEDFKSISLIKDLVRIIKKYFSGYNRQEKIRINFDFRQIEDKLGCTYF